VQEGFSIPYASSCTYPALLNFITPKGADILVEGLRKRAFEPGYVADIPKHLTDGKRAIRHAPKITTEDRHINFHKMSSEEIVRRNRVLGRLWFYILPSRKRSWFGASQPSGNPNLAEKRVVCHKVSSMQLGLSLSAAKQHEKNLKGGKSQIKYFTMWDKQEQTEHRRAIERYGNAVLVPAGTFKLGSALDIVRIEEVTIEGANKMSAGKALFEVFDDIVKPQQDGKEGVDEKAGPGPQKEEGGKRSPAGAKPQSALNQNAWKYGVAIGLVFSMLPFHVPIIDDIIYLVFPFLDKREKPSPLPIASGRNLYEDE